MRLISQGYLSDVDYDKVSLNIIEKEDKFNIIAIPYFGTGNITYTMGSYNTLEDCQNIIKEIAQKYSTLLMTNVDENLSSVLINQDTIENIIIDKPFSCNNITAIDRLVYFFPENK